MNKTCDGCKKVFNLDYDMFVSMTLYRKGETRVRNECASCFREADIEIMDKLLKFENITFEQLVEMKRKCEVFEKQ